MLELPLHIVEVNSNDEILYYLTHLPLEDIQTFGLRSDVILGQAPLNDGKPSLEDIKINRDFRKTLDAFCAKHISNELIEEAKRQGEGYVYYIDYRTATPNGAVGKEDIIGGYELKGGQIVGYRPNPNHLLRTKDGFFNLGQNGNVAFIQYLRELASKP